VLNQAFTFAVFMTGGLDAIGHIVEGGGAQVSGLSFIWYALGGIVVGYVGWWNQEGKYKKARLNSRLQTPFDDRIMPR
jgi:hypothetical protein